MAIDPGLITTIRVGELPPNPFSLTDKIPHEVGTDLKQGTIQELIDFISPFVNAIQFQVITLHVNQAYIDANFDVTGLGTNLMIGYAIVNGNNGTLNIDGKVDIAYGSTYNVIGQTGGSKDAVVVAHSHNIRRQSKNASGAGSEYVLDNSGVSATMSTTESTGVSGVNKNMQPYIVVLKVMKL